MKNRGGGGAFIRGGGAFIRDNTVCLHMYLILYVQNNTIYGKNGEKVPMQCLRNIFYCLH